MKIIAEEVIHNSILFPVLMSILFALAVHLITILYGARFWAKIVLPNVTLIAIMLLMMASIPIDTYTQYTAIVVEESGYKELVDNYDIIDTKGDLYYIKDKD